MKNMLTIEQCKAMMNQMKPSDRALFLALLLGGPDIRTWTWNDVIEKSLDMPVVLWFTISAYAASRGIPIIPTSEIVKLSKSNSDIRVHWISGLVYDDAVWTANSGIVARLVNNKVIKTKIASARPLTTQEITRRMKRYARLARLDVSKVNLRTVINSHHYFSTLYSVDKLAEALGLSSTRQTERIAPAGTGKAGAFVPVTFRTLRNMEGNRVERDPRLHGIGRRTKSRIPVR